MRRVLFLGLVALAGCGKTPVSSAPVAPAVAATDPLVEGREKDAQAAFSLDAASASLDDALAGAKKLAPRAGGDAKEALMNVAAMLDSAGTTLADHDDPPPPMEEYRKGDPAANRKKALDDAVDALHELRDAAGVLDDLSQNAPPAFAKPLDEIQSSLDEALESVEDAVKSLGGTVPPEEDGQSSNERS